jgi:hypothetical protein
MSEQVGHESSGNGTGGSSGTATGVTGVTGPPVTAPVRDLAAEHQTWLAAAQLQLTRVFQDEWCSSGDWSTIITKEQLFNYMSPLDGPAGQVVLWRFTSQPANEFIQITAGTPLTTIITVIGAHSGGADKSNPDVKTSSLCRNLGALMGTAASLGGDKKVLNIINKAAYLYGIDVTTLAAHGVSAHPALSRVISVIETEYVLVPTPGLPALSIDQLATYKWPNPFRGRINTNGTVSGSTVVVPISEQQKGAYQQLHDEPVQPPGLAVTNGSMSSANAEGLLKFAAAASTAASQQSGVIQMKEPADRVMLIRAAQTNVSKLKDTGIFS